MVFGISCLCFVLAHESSQHDSAPYSILTDRSRVRAHYLLDSTNAPPFFECVRVPRLALEVIRVATNGAPPRIQSCDKVSRAAGRLHEAELSRAGVASTFTLTGSAVC